MNCPDVRAALPEFVYEGLSPEVRDEMKRHLDGCPECRREETALRQVRSLLTAAPAPEVRVDTAAVYRQAAERQARRVRRWRRVAVAACAAAVLIAAGMGLSRLEIHVGSTEMVVRWGRPAAAPEPATTPAALPPPAAPVAAVDPRDIDSIKDRLNLLSELTQALADDGRERDEQRGQEIARLREQLRQWQGLSAERLRDMQKDFDALYVAQFPSRKGVNP